MIDVGCFCSDFGWGENTFEEILAACCLVIILLLYCTNEAVGYMPDSGGQYNKCG
ncbi:MAG: hypothetical protein ACYCVD_10150 [Desulfitobacteriaceae bacterium]